MTVEPLVLLAGPTALGLAQRLTASGYATVDWLCAGVTANAASQGEEPVAAVLGAGQAALIPDLRTRFRRMPIFLDLVEDTTSPWRRGTGVAVAAECGFLLTHG